MSTQRLKRTKVISVLIGATLAFTTLTAPAANAGTVPNMFYRTCSHVTGHCTPYVQTNKPDPSVGRAYYTTWCWCWIW